MKFFTHWLLIQLAASISTASPALTGRIFYDTDTIPAILATGDSTTNFVSSQYNLDGPQLSSINSTSWDWWYFDVISSDLNTSLVIVFYTALPSGFPFLSPSADVTVIGIYVTFPNGTQTNINLDATEAVVTTIEDGSCGVFEGSGAAWFGTPNMSSYLVAIDAPASGIVGNFQLSSINPAHYPCGPAGFGVSMTAGPNIGWSNAVPDAEGIVDFEINGSSLAFTGLAYHDKNWSDQPFFENVASWYWGHGRLGEYSIVWFDFLGLDGTEYVSAYAAKNDQILTASCQEGSVIVRPSGVNDKYPPEVTTGNPGGFTIEMDLGTAGILSVNVTVKSILTEAETFYTRFAGSMVGSLNGGELIEGGVALFEQFKLTE